MSNERKDNVNHPSHYESGKFECIDVMTETQGTEYTTGFCVCNAFKYIYRWQNKNGIEDLKKAKWYLERAISILEPVADSEVSGDERKKA